LEYGR